MASAMVRERAILPTYQFAICTGRRLLFNCLETARFVRILETTISSMAIGMKLFLLAGYCLILFQLKPARLVRLKFGS